MSCALAAQPGGFEPHDLPEPTLEGRTDEELARIEDLVKRHAAPVNVYVEDEEEKSPGPTG